MLNWVRIICAAVILWHVVTAWPVDPNPPGPVNPDWPAPSVELQSALAPVVAVMDAAESSKAKAWAGAWEEYLSSIYDDTPPETTGAFKSQLATAMNESASQLNLSGAFPGFTSAMDAAFADYFGAEDAPLDWTKAKEFVSAVVWACH